jgi:hypothetical protein
LFCWPAEYCADTPFAEIEYGCAIKMEVASGQQVLVGQGAAEEANIIGLYFWQEGGKTRKGVRWQISF